MERPNPKFPWKPEFGNPEQIRALRAYERMMDEIEGTKTFEVEIPIEATYRTTIIARSREEAIDIALEKFNILDAECDLGHATAREVTDDDGARGL